MRVVVVGAGLAGLVAAGELAAAGADVTVVDKGRSAGGRLATRRMAGARVDHGAQFFTVRTPAFADRVERWSAAGLVRVWAHGFPSDDGHPRYIATGGMNSIAKELASGLAVECATMAFAIRPTAPGAATRWEVAIDDGTVRPADAVIVTCPLPQAMALLVDSGLDVRTGPFRTEYDRTIALLAVLDRPSAIPPPGGVQLTGGALSFVADNQAKGVSEIPAVTIHANPTWSEDHWDEAHDILADSLESAARRWLGEAAVVERQVKKWRFATPRTIWPEPCWQGAGGAIVLAGDAFAGPRVEGAHNSGLAAAHALLA